MENQTFNATPSVPSVNRKKLSKVISTCTAEDLNTWRQTHNYILKNITSENYEVIVPDLDFDAFRLATNKIYSVTPESHYIKPAIMQVVRDAISAKAPNRIGWYLQQFLKIECAKQQVHANDYLLIWDADTLPLKPLEFLDDKGNLYFYTGVENHAPYFDTLARLTGTKKIFDDSFIAQCIPLQANHAKEFCRTIEIIHKKDWMIAVCDCLDGSSISEFSEYESLGNFISTNYPDQVRLADGRWHRRGTSIFGSASDIAGDQINLLSKYYDFIAFERWDDQPFRGANIGCGNQRLEKTYLGNSILNIDIEDFAASDFLLDCNDSKWCFRDNQFEHVIINSVIEHVNSPLNVFKELNRIMAPGGVLQFEVPFISSYNHGTHITHVRGFTFDSFNFLFNKDNYLYRYEDKNPFDFRLVQFWRENVIDGRLVHESFDKIPSRHGLSDWLQKLHQFVIPGTFGFVLQKIS